jgi:hypothetical protein
MDFEEFAMSTCAKWRQEQVPLDSSLLKAAVVQSVKAQTKAEINRVVILADECGRLHKLLGLPPGDSDEFTGLRSLSRQAFATVNGFSVAVVQAGLGDFAERTTSSRRILHVALPEQTVRNVVDNWILHSEQARSRLHNWKQATADRCQSEELKKMALEDDRWDRWVLSGVVEEYLPLARALQFLTEAIENKAPHGDTGCLSSELQLDSEIRLYGGELREVVDKQLGMMYKPPSDLLSPAVLAPAILPSGKFRVALGDTVGGVKVSTLLSEAAFTNSLRNSGPDAKFLPTILPAFLRKASEDSGLNAGLSPLRQWWAVMKTPAVLLSRRVGVGELLETGMRVWLLTILQALWEYRPELPLCCTAHTDWPGNVERISMILRSICLSPMPSAPIQGTTVPRS